MPPAFSRRTGRNAAMAGESGRIELSSEHRGRLRIPRLPARRYRRIPDVNGPERANGRCCSQSDAFTPPTPLQPIYSEAPKEGLSSEPVRPIVGSSNVSRKSRGIPPTRESHCTTMDVGSVNLQWDVAGPRVRVSRTLPFCAKPHPHKRNASDLVRRTFPGRSGAHEREQIRKSSQ